MAVLCWSSRKEIPHVQGKRNPSKTVGIVRGHQRADTLKPYSQKTSQSNHTGTTALSNSMKLSQGGRVMVERSDKMWSTGEGNDKALQYSCLENPMNSMKRQNDRILKEELPRSVRWMWIWVNSGSWWWTGRPGVLWFMGSQRVRHNWATELNWTDDAFCKAHNVEKEIKYVTQEEISEILLVEGDISVVLPLAS